MPIRQKAWIFLTSLMINMFNHIVLIKHDFLSLCAIITIYLLKAWIFIIMYGLYAACSVWLICLIISCFKHASCRNYTRSCWVKFMGRIMFKYVKLKCDYVKPKATRLWLCTHNLWNLMFEYYACKYAYRTNIVNSVHTIMRTKFMIN